MGPLSHQILSLFFILFVINPSLPLAEEIAAESKELALDNIFANENVCKLSGENGNSCLESVSSGERKTNSNINQEGFRNTDESILHQKRQKIQDQLLKLRKAVLMQQELVTQLGHQLKAQVAELDAVSKELNMDFEMPGELFNFQPFSSELLQFPTSNDRKGTKASLKLSEAWDKCFDHLVTINLDAKVTQMQVIPTEPKSFSRRYLSYGDTEGNLYVKFLPHDGADLSHMSASSATAKLETPSRSPVSALLGISNRRNETWIVTGHNDGSVFLYSLKEEAFWDDDEVVEGSKLPPSVKLLRVLVQADETTNFAPIIGLETFKSGSLRYVVATDSLGSIFIFRSNGSLYGSAKSPQVPLTFLRTPNSGRLYFLTETLAGSLDLKSMKVNSKSCRGLNGSRVVAYAFESLGRSRAYGVTAQQEVVDVALTGDSSGAQFECRVRYKRTVAVQLPVGLVKVKGYLALVNREIISLFNVSVKMTFAGEHGKSPLRPLLDLPVQALTNSPIPQDFFPLVSSNRDHTVAILLPNGAVHVLESVLPVWRPRKMEIKYWSSPVVAVAILFLGAWHFYRSRVQGSSSALNALNSRVYEAINRENREFSKGFSSPDEGVGRGFKMGNSGREIEEVSRENSLGIGEVLEDRRTATQSLGSRLFERERESGRPVGSSLDESEFPRRFTGRGTMDPMSTYPPSKTAWRRKGVDYF